MTSDLHARAKAVVGAMTKGPWGSIGFANIECALTSDPGCPSTFEDAQGLALLRDIANAALDVIAAGRPFAKCWHDDTLGIAMLLRQAYEKYDAAMREHFEREGT